ncbi:hypothetical protein [Flavicella sediminum]|uniref:hypothetical protein n=1 Tax=Flavicella sediminum TaxID=2585141 RepID=UPI001123F087|nr:hypothetical protein [Flavicella sediminum]
MRQVFIIAVLFVVSNICAQKNNFIKGGQFKDLILPMPIINGLESQGLWGNVNVIPRDKDNGIEDNE